MQKSEQNWIKKRSSLITLGILLLADVLLITLYWNTQHVMTTLFNKLDPEPLNQQIQRISHSKNTCLITATLNSDAKSSIEAEAGMKSVSECTQDCGICLTITENPTAVKQKAQIVVKEGSFTGQIDAQITLKNQNKLPRDLGKILHKLVSKCDSCIIKQNQNIENPTLYQLKSLEVTQIKLINEITPEEQNNGDFLDASLLQAQSDNLLSPLYGSNSVQNRPELVFKRDYLTQEALPQIFNRTDTSTFFSAEGTLQYFSKTSQHHLIPEFSLAVEDLVKHIKIYLFDSTDPELAFLKATGEKYQVITSESSASIFAIINSKEDKAVYEKIGKLVELALREALEIETMQQVANYARKKQVKLVDERADQPVKENFAIFREKQLKLHTIKALKNMIQISSFLDLSYSSHSGALYENMSLHELASHTYEELLRFAEKIDPKNSVEVPSALLDKIGTLMHTRDVNSDIWKKGMFLVGIYMPIFAPFLAPFAVTLGAIMKLKINQIRAN